MNNLNLKCFQLLHSVSSHPRQCQILSSMAHTVKNSIEDLIEILHSLFSDHSNCGMLTDTTYSMNNKKEDFIQLFHLL